MGEAKGGRFTWRLPIFGGLGAVVLMLPTLVRGNDASAFFASIPLAFLIAIILLAIALTKLRHHTWEVVMMISIFFVLTWSLFRSSDLLRTTTRWFIHSRNYKVQVLSQPPPLDGNLKHVEWDGWGFAGAGDTTVYLVNDPSDRLAAATGRQLPGKLRGIPCEVMQVRRLESYWYTVLFFTDTDWGHCA